MSVRTAPAADPWICLHSENFELFTTSDERSGHDALVFFEQVRLAFTEILGVKLPERRPITIVAFRNEQAFAPYKPQNNVAAYSMNLPGRDFIVMQDLVPEHYPVGLHEFTHVMTSQAGIKLPVWLAEGFAEVYSTLKPSGRKIVLGHVIPARLQMVQAGMIDLREVLRADRQSPLYHDDDRIGIYYAESWALAHMLKFGEKYSARFDRVLDAIGRGESSEQALQTVYGETIEQIQLDLAAYVHGNHFREGVINGKLDKPVTEPKQVPADQVDVAVMLAAIEIRGPRRQEAVNKLQELTDANPTKLAPLEALAWIRLAGNDPQATVTSFLRALEAGTRDPNLCFQFAIKMRAVIPDTDYVAALRRAVEIDPGFSAAQKELGAYAFNKHDYAEAVTRLHLVKKLERKDAFTYYRALAFAAFQTGDLKEAKSAATRTQEFAVTAEEKRQAEEMVRFVNSDKTPTKAPGFGDNPLPLR